MLYREIIAVCSQIHTKHINKLCGQNVELLNFKLLLHPLTGRLYKVTVSVCSVVLLLPPRVYSLITEERRPI